MKAKLIFTLPEDDYNHRLAVMAEDMAAFMYKFENYLRENWKHRETPDDIDTIYTTWNEMKPELPEG